MELKLKLGVGHSTSTIRRYMVETGPPRSSTWRQFLASHADQIFVMDFTPQPLWNYSMRYVLVIMRLKTREVVQVAVTANPTLDWLNQQIREATRWDGGPRFLIHDNDGFFGQFGHRKAAPDDWSGKRYRCALDLWLHQVLGIEGIPIPYGAPNAAAHIERFMGTLKRECLNHFIFFTEAQLRRTAVEFTDYHNEARPHQGIRGIPSFGPGKGPERPEPSDDVPLRLAARPVLGGLHHDYELARSPRSQAFALVAGDERDPVSWGEVRPDSVPPGRLTPGRLLVEAFGVIGERERHERLAIPASRNAVLTGRTG